MTSASSEFRRGSHHAEVPSGMCTTTVLQGTNANPYLESRCAGSLRRTA